MKNLSQAARGHLAMLLFSAVVAGSFSLGSLTANDIDPLALTAIRFLFASVILAVITMATTGVPTSAVRAPWRYLVLGGLFALYFVLMFEGLKTARPVSASSVFTLVPLMAGGIGWLVFRQAMTRRMLIALVVGAFGALWVIFRGDTGALLAFDLGRGEAIYFVGCVSHALFTPMARRLNRGEPAVMFSLGILVAGFVVLAFVGWSEIRATRWLDLPWLVWVTIAYLGIFASALTTVLLQYATVRLPSAKVLAYTYLTPSWVIMLELIIGHGAPPLLMGGGVALTVVALLMLLKNEE
ncbi:drug/metabolite transporter (DMT)-like permease [Rhodobacteraceae bacterium MBR-64]|jgi:drug/metabolite transporter (DMT)-like permease